MALGLSLVPRAGIRGAAAALLVSSVVNLAMALALARGRIGKLPFFSHLIRPLTAGAAMVVGFLVLRPVSPWLGARAACVTYVVALLLLQPEVKRLWGSREVAGQYHVDVVDAGRVLDESPADYYDACHFDANGHLKVGRLLAERISAILAEMLSIGGLSR